MELMLWIIVESRPKLVFGRQPSIMISLKESNQYNRFKFVWLNYVLYQRFILHWDNIPSQMHYSYRHKANKLSSLWSWLRTPPYCSTTFTLYTSRRWDIQPAFGACPIWAEFGQAVSSRSVSVVIMDPLNDMMIMDSLHTKRMMMMIIIFCSLSARPFTSILIYHHHYYHHQYFEWSNLEGTNQRTNRLNPV